MNKVIKDYYEQGNPLPIIMNQKMEKLSRNPDVCEEFEFWILNREYKKNSVTINGYTAEKLAAISKYLDGEGAFMLLIELREQPEKALKRIAEGFDMK